ncbi:MAG: hypothetical protein K0Q72_4019 [Armatimonadetes bacterium]|jgi:hypothetical protein|nr:hypothetical protein [Armatimonadota bacterium]
MVTQAKRPLAGILAATMLCGVLALATAGCGPEAQNVTPAAAPNNTPPGGGSPDDYAKKMQELKGGKTPGGPTSPGGPPGPGAGR